MQDAEKEVIRKLKRREKALAQGLLVRILFALAFLLLFFQLLFGVGTVPSNAMYPAVRAGDLAVYIREGEWRVTDAVFYEDSGGKVRIGRIAAKEGDVIGADEEGRVTINGRFLPEDPARGIFYETKKREKGFRYPEEVPEGYFFILGDQREEAEDSRDFGLIPEDRIEGKVFTIWRRRAV